MSELPAGWVEATLEDVVSDGPTNGYSPKAGPDGTGSTSLKLSATTSGTFVLNESTTKVLHETVPDDSKYWLEPGDLLIQRANSLEYLGVAAMFPGSPRKVIYPDLMMRVRCNAACETKFLWRYLNTGEARTYFRDNATGTAGNMPKINGKTVKGINVPLPPLNEQKRIVAKIDALTEKSRAAREALAEVPELLDKLRQSILAAAFRGDLTKKWREQNPDVEPATVLLERIRAERRKKWEEAELAKFKAKGKVPTDDRWKAKYVEPEPVDTDGLPDLPIGWCWASLEELVAGDRTSAYGVLKPGPEVPNGIRLIKSGQVRDGFMDLSEDYRIHPELHRQYARTEIQGGEVLLNLVGASIGRSAIAPATITGANVSRAIAVLPVRPSEARWAQRGLQGPAGRRLMAEATGGSAQPVLNLAEVRRLPLPLCTEHEMNEVLKRIEALFELAGSFAVALADDDGTLTGLDSSILAKAFRGELVPQDPNDEPASVLLERVRKERDAAAAKTERPKRGAQTRV